MASPGNRPGFFDTMRQGWAPPSRRFGADGAAPAGSAAAGTRRKPAARGKGAGARRAGAKGDRASAPSAGSPELVKRRDELAKQFAELQWDLGGIAYEMARRDHYRLDLLNVQAAKLQEVDAELGQIERMLKLDEAGAAGECPSCGAMQARGAVFCWHCGNELQQPSTATPKPADGAATASPKPPAKAGTNSTKAAKPAAKQAAAKAKTKRG